MMDKMQDHDWVRGVLQIPAADWAGFRRGLIKKHNDLALENLQKARELHGVLKEQLLGKRGAVRQRILRDFCEQHHEKVSGEVLGLVVSAYRIDSRQAAYEFLPAPTRKNIPLRSALQDGQLKGQGWTITLCNEDRTVTWEARDKSLFEATYAHPLVQHFFGVLERLEWTRGSGGHLYAGGTRLGEEMYKRVVASYGRERPAPLTRAGYSNFGGGGFSTFGVGRRN